MKVKELLQLLQDAPEEAVVVFEHRNSAFVPAEESHSIDSAGLDENGDFFNLISVG